MMNYIQARKEQMERDLSLIKKHEEFNDVYIGGEYDRFILKPNHENNSGDCLAVYGHNGININYGEAYKYTNSSRDDLFDVSQGLIGLEELKIKTPYPQNIEDFINHMVELRPSRFKSQLDGRLDIRLSYHREGVIYDKGRIFYDFLDMFTDGKTRFSGMRRLFPSDYREFEELLLKISDFIDSFKEEEK